MIDVAVKQVEATQKFQCQFKSLVTNCLSEKDGTVDVLTFDLAITVVYKELCFIKGKSTLAGQNLRDELLTSHVNTKSFLN